ncbi:hypothetical protein BDC45DRAFT_570790 [Circinella umbellata]|nr:hypothetical protein BDC45DRAFT_570790 [Circinella umbellata]
MAYYLRLMIQTDLVNRRDAAVHKQKQQEQKDYKEEDPEDIIIFLQHPPTSTHITMRGGQIRYHESGQFIGYPILNVRDY